MTTYILALIFDSKGNHKEAIFYLIETIEKNSRFEKAYTKLGEMFLARNEVDKALHYF